MLSVNYQCALFALLFLVSHSRQLSAKLHDAHRVCVYEGKVLSPGSRFQSDSCTDCRCPRRGGQVVCTVEDCRDEPNCLRHVNVTSTRSCCPKCAEYGCRYTDGKLYAGGETISSDACSRCYCPLKGGQSTCKVAPCPPIRCVDFVRRPGGCCPRCPQGSNCQLGMQVIPFGAVVTSGSSLCRCELKLRGNNSKLEATCYGLPTEHVANHF